MYRKNIVCIEFSNISSFSHPLVGGVRFLESISLRIREGRDTVTRKRISGFGEKTYKLLSIPNNQRNPNEIENKRMLVLSNLQNT